MLPELVRWHEPQNNGRLAPVMPKKKPVAPATSKKKTRTWQAVLAVVIVGAIATFYFMVGRSSAPSGDAAGATDILNTTASMSNRFVLPATPHNPRPQTLDPSSFADPDVREAYQAAKDVPEVLEHLACYCGCFREAGHRNNLDCFKDMHGTQCALCRAIAIEGRKEHNEGVPIEQIKHNIDAKWAPSAAH